MDKEVSTPAPLAHEKAVPVHSAVWLSFADCMCSLMCSAAEGGVLTYFFVYHLGLEWRLASIVWLIFGIWNAINDPIYGFIADRTKSKLGRRIPWIRFGGPIYAALFILMWVKFPAMMGNQGFLFAQMLVCLFFFDILYTAVASALYVMPYEMAVTNKARSPIFIWKIVFSLVSTGLPMVFSGKLSDLLSDPTNNPNGYQTFLWIMIGVGIVGGLVIFFSTFFYHENGYIKDEAQPKFWAGLKACLKNKAFLLFEVVSITVIFAQSNLMLGLTAAWTMWGDEAGWLGVNLSQYICLGTMVVGAVLALLLFVKVRDKWGAKNCAIIMCVAMGLGCFLGAFLGRYFPAMVIAFFLIGVGFAGGMYIVPVLNGDVIDKDELDNGFRREGTYAGVNSLITKPFMSIAQVTYMAILEGIYGLTHTEDGQGQPIYDWAGQLPETKNGFFIAWFLISGILLVLSAVAMYFFPLHGKQWNEEKAALAKKHAEKEAAYEQEILAREAADKAAAPKA
jgi:GPH family glycoside/pentoside/hexuronide:cation symporter